MATRSGAGRSRQPSTRKVLGAETEAHLDQLEQEQQPRKRKKSHPQGSKNGKQAAVEQNEFEFETLSTNRTSKRAKNAIKLTANTDGIPAATGKANKLTANANRMPAAKGKATPVQMKADQRKPAVTAPPSNPKHILTPAAAAKLRLLRLARVTPSRSASPSQVAPQPQQPREASSVPAKHASLQGPQGQRQPSTNSAPSQTGTPAPSHAATRTATPNMDNGTQQPSSAQLSQPRLPSASAPPRRLRSPSPPPSRESSPENDDEIGTIPRIQEPYHIASLDDDDDRYTDPGVLYEDFGPKARARAEALAYDPQYNIPNPDAYNEDFEDAEQYEMDDDPDADLGDGDAEHPGSRGDGCSDDNVPADAHSETQGSRRVSADDADQNFPVAQHKALPAGQKAGMRDYEPQAREVLERAITIFKTHITADNAYPDNLQERTWAKSAWERAAADLGIEIKHDGRSLELIQRYSWALRGEIKSFARHFVPGVYGFKQVLSTDAEGVQRNVELARELLEKNAFKYQEPHARMGLFEGDIIQVIINKVFYKNPSDDGVIHDDVYRPFPLRGVALVLTSIQCAIQEWSTGLHRNVNFDERIYKSEYEVHERDLRHYETKSKDLKIVSAICLKLAQYGRDHAKAPLTSQHGPSGALESDELDRAVEAYRLKLQGG